MATAKEYTDNLFTAIKNIANASIVDISKYDSTQLYTIEEDLTKTYDKGYRVGNNSKSFIAYAMTDQKYQVGDSVYVLIPNNDENAQKFIMGGSYSSLSNVKSYISPLRRMVILKQGEIENTILTTDQSVILELQSALPAFLQAPTDMRTKSKEKNNLYLNLSIRVKNKDSDFSLKFEPMVKDDNIDIEGPDPLIWSCKDMIGNYKNFMVPFKQEKTFAFLANKVRITLVGGNENTQISEIKYAIGFDQSAFVNEGILLGSDQPKEYNTNKNINLTAYWIRKDKDGLFYTETKTDMFKDNLREIAITPKGRQYETIIKYKDKDEKNEPISNPDEIITGNSFNSLTEKKKETIKNLGSREQSSVIKNYSTSVKFSADSLSENVKFKSDVIYILKIQLNCAKGENFESFIASTQIKVDFSEKEEDDKYKRNAFEMVNYSIKLNEETQFYDLTILFKLKEKQNIVIDSGSSETLEEDEKGILTYSTKNLFPISIISDNSTLNNWSLFTTRTSQGAQGIADGNFYFDHEPEYFLKWYRLNPDTASGKTELQDAQTIIENNENPANTDKKNPYQLLNQSLNASYATQTYICELVNNNILKEDEIKKNEIVFQNLIEGATNENTSLKSEGAFQITTIDNSEGKEYSADGIYYIYDENHKANCSSSERYLALNATGNYTNTINNLAWYFPYANETMVDIQEDNILQMTADNGELLWGKIDSLEPNSLVKGIHVIRWQTSKKDEDGWGTTYYGPYTLTKDNSYRLKFSNLPEWEEISGRTFKIDIYKSISSINKETKSFNQSLGCLYRKNNQTDYLNLKNNGLEFEPPNEASLFTTNTDRNFYIMISYTKTAKTQKSYVQNTKLKVEIANEYLLGSYKKGTNNIRWKNNNGGWGTSYYVSYTLNPNETYKLTFKDFPTFTEIGGKNFRIDIYDNAGSIEQKAEDKFKNIKKNLYNKSLTQTNYDNLIKGLEFTVNSQIENACILLSYEKSLNNNVNYLTEVQIKVPIKGRNLYSENNLYKKRYRGYKYIGTSPNQSTLQNGDYSEIIKNTFKIPFQLKNYYNPSYSRNTIKCVVDGRKYEKELQFGKTNIQGTGYRLNVVYAENNREYIWYNTNTGKIVGDEGYGTAVGFRIELANENGVLLEREDISIKIISNYFKQNSSTKKYEWQSNVISNEKTVKSNEAFYLTPTHKFGSNVLVATTTIDGITLTAKLPLIFYHSNSNEIAFTANSSKSGELKYILGPTSMRYNSNGTLDENQSFGPYRLVSSTGARLQFPNNAAVMQGEANTQYDDEKISTTCFDIIKENEEYYLKAPNIWLNNMNNPGIYVRLKRNNYTIYIPIVPSINRWETSNSINKWNGEYGSSSNDPNFFPYIGVGEKNNKNAFSGVYIGQTKLKWPKYNTESSSWEKENISSWWGLVGQKEGTLTFGIRADTGSAYFKGEIQATSGTFTGKVVSGSGEIGGWGLTGNSLYSTKGTGGYATLKSSGKVALALGMDISKTEESDTSKAGAKLQIFHSGTIRLRTGASDDKGEDDKNETYTTLKLTSSDGNVWSAGEGTFKKGLSVGSGNFKISGNGIIENLDTISAGDVTCSGGNWTFTNYIYAQGGIGVTGGNIGLTGKNMIYAGGSDSTSGYIVRMAPKEYDTTTCIYMGKHATNWIPYFYVTWGGAVHGSNGVWDLSDVNQKNTISTMSNKYSQFFDYLQPISFKYNAGTSDRFHIGFISQQVEEALIKAELNSQDFAGLVINKDDDEQTRYYLRYNEFIALNTNEIQKLKKRVNQLESEVSSLKEQLLNINN